MTDSKKPEFREDDAWFSEAQLDRLAPADHADPVHSPIPTQMVSNGEYMPIGQTDKQREVETRLKALSEQAAKELGMSRRKFLTTTGGFAASFLAMNEVFGHFFDVRPIDMLVPEACHRTLAIFDGRMRYDLRLSYKRMDKVKAKAGYQGAVVVCSVFFSPVAGHIPERSTIQYLAAQRDMEIWFAPLAGTRLMVPYRIQVPTPIGLGVLEATQFVSTPQGRAAAGGTDAMSLVPPSLPSSTSPQPRSPR